MVNDCIRIGLAENVTSLKSLSLKAYSVLAYETPSYYKLCAISAAVGILRNYRRAKRKNPRTKTPYAKKLRLTTCYGFKIVDGAVRLSIRPHEYELIPLNKHTLKVLSEPSLNIRSVTLTPSTIGISFSHETAEIECVGQLGIDRNLDNVTIAESKGETHAYDLSEATRIKSTYREVKSHLKRNDVRIRRKIFGKYGVKQRNRVKQILHRTSKDIVEKAKKSKSAIVMEKLTGLRKLYRRGNGQGRNYRAKMNSWSFGELQRQIEYKAKWEGLPIIYVPPQKTSSTCAICGSQIECTGRMVWCSNCQTLVDRDINAARNLAKRGLRFSPVEPPNEAMVAEATRKVDGGQITRCPEELSEPGYEQDLYRIGGAE
jgi:putative transposase